MMAPTHDAAVVPGVAAGLVAAAASAVSYLITRHHGRRSRGGGLRMLVLAHVLMGAACLPLAWLLRPAEMPPAARWLPPLVGSTGFYLAGQAAVLAALRRMHASRLAPLLGLKIAMLAVFVSFLPREGLDIRQWIAVALSVAAAAMLQRGGGGTPRAAFAIVLAACAAFALSDLCIVSLIDGLHGPPATPDDGATRLRAAALAMAVTYVLCGGIAVAFLPRVGSWSPVDWSAAAQYGVAWLGGMVALYTCFGLVGAVFGNILQSTRGVIAVVLGAILAHAGWNDLEERVDGGTLARRTVAALLMTAAIALYAVDLS